MKGQVISQKEENFGIYNGNRSDEEYIWRNDCP